MNHTTPHKPITSRDNGIIKNLRALSDPRHRRKEQTLLIEGVKMVEEALRDNVGVTLVVAAPSLVQHHGKVVLKLAESRSVDVLWISEKVMDFLSESKTPQPVLAVVKMQEHTEDELLSLTPGLIIIAHELQDPGNLGTIIRTAEAVGASGLALSPHTVDPYSAKAVRASMGSILRVPVVRIADITSFIRLCQQSGFQTAATLLTGETSHFDADLLKPTAVIIGQEGGGLPQDIADHIDVRVRIPMSGTIDSLNVATATAVFLYEALRQRTKKTPAH